MNKIPVRLKELRKKFGWTQEQVTEKLNISIGTLSGYERGYRRPDTEMLGKLAALYNTSADYILGSTNNPSPPQDLEPPDLESYLNEPDVGRAYIKISELKYQYSLPNEKVHEMIDKAAVHFGILSEERKSEGGKAAHTNGNCGGSGIFKGSDRE